MKVPQISMDSIEHMCYTGGMDAVDKLAYTAQAAIFEQDGSESAGAGCAGYLPAGSKASGVAFRGHTIPVYQAAFPGGRRFHFAEPSGNEFAVWGEGA